MLPLSPRFTDPASYGVNDLNDAAFETAPAERRSGIIAQTSKGIGRVRSQGRAVAPEAGKAGYRMFFRKGKDETDEFTRIREAVRVDEAIEEGSAAAWPRPPVPAAATDPAVLTGLPARPALPGRDALVPQPQTSPPQPAAQNGTVISPETSFDGRVDVGEQHSRSGAGEGRDSR